MSLYDIKDKLYKKEVEKDLSKHEESGYDPHVANLPKTPSENVTDLWAEKQSGLGEVQKIAIKRGAWVLGGITILLVVVGVIYLIKESAYSQSRVIVKVVGLDKVESGKAMTYEIDYQNNNRADLNNAVIRISYPEDFKPENNPDFKQDSPIISSINLGTIKGKAEGKIVFNGRIYSPKGALLYLKAEMKYNPSSSSTQYTSNGQLGINVNTSPVSVEVMAPQYVSSGDEVGYLISFRNNGETALTNLRIKAEYPEGFTFSSSDPKSSEGNNIWYVGNLDPGQTGKITATGKLEGTRDQTKSIKVYIGSSEQGEFVSFNDEETSTKMASSPLTITQLMNGANNPNINAGENLNFQVYYKNEGDTGLKDVIITERIDSPILNYGSLDTQGGAFDMGNKIITWKASDHPQLRNLQPGQGGVVGFSINVKDSIPMNNANDKNYVVSSVVKIDSPDIPTPISMNKIIAGNVLDMKLNSKILLGVKGFYTDTNITNSGPTPPKVGQETTYTFHWIVSNVSNDVSNATVEAVLPTGVKMTGKIFPEDAKITYNERNNSIIWEIGNVDAAKGILSAPQEASFQVKVTPAPSQAGKELELLKPSVFKAHDLFTGEDLIARVDGKNTSLPEDVSLNEKYIVVN
jgi:uncharacterized repeat protein (TIGR01451 family)